MSYCKHNEMVPNDDPRFAWKCADCGYVYGREDSNEEDPLIKGGQGRTDTDILDNCWIVFCLGLVCLAIASAVSMLLRLC